MAFMALCMPLENLQMRASYKDTKLGNKLSQRGYTLSMLAKESGVRIEDVSNYLRGRREKVGRSRRKLIRMHLVRLGLAKSAKRKPPKCRTCGTEYPTRVNV
jgi:hypothetical protein